jgi:hypothetical protein
MELVEVILPVILLSVAYFLLFTAVQARDIAVPTVGPQRAAVKKDIRKREEAELSAVTGAPGKRREKAQ